ncbi:MAG: iron ABC transporter permease [Gemmatimonadetes bacterium]|nr:iron ABC transporter permease [Gemmatimonadota bacterium]
MALGDRRAWLPDIRSLSWGWTTAAVVLVALLSIPLMVVAAGALRPAGEAWGHIGGTLLPEYVRHTAVLTMAAGGLALVFGGGTAWLVAMCDFPLRSFFRWALILPLAVPAYMAAYAYAGMLDVTGPVQRLVRQVVPGATDGFYSWHVMRIEVVALIFGAVLYPYVFLLTRSLLEQRSGRVLEAARLLGRGPWAVFFRVAIPLARPALAAGVALVLMEILNDYGAVTYYGITTFTTGIFRAWFSLGDLDTAIRLSAILMAAVLIVLGLERWQRGAARYHDVTAAHPAARYRLNGAAAAAAVMFCSLPLLLGFVLPVAQLSAWALRVVPAAGAPGLLTLARNSFLLALVAALLCVGIAIVIVYAARLDRSPVTRSVGKLALLGYSIPGAVIAVGVLVAVLAVANRVEGAGALLITGSVAALMFGYVVRFMAVGILSVESGFARVGQSLPAAARLLGAAPLRTLARVELPLLRRSLLAAVTLVFIDVLKELPLTLILRPFNFDTLATRAFQLASDEQLAQSAPAALLVIGTAALVVGVLHSAFEQEVRA